MHDKPPGGGEDTGLYTSSHHTPGQGRLLADPDGGLSNHFGDRASRGLELGE